MNQNDWNKRRAWLLISTDQRAFAGNNGYEDSINSSYKWDSTVKYAALLKRGDIIVIFDKVQLIGASIIDEIAVGKSTKQRLRCPNCKSTSLRKRKTKVPLYRCQEQDCCLEFDDAISEHAEVVTYSSTHEAGWIDLDGLASGAELRSISPTPKAPDSIRPLDFEKFVELISQRAPNYEIPFVEGLASDQSHGHSLRQVRVRIGQGKFRTSLIETYGASCAVTGPTHQAAIEACHLYSYAKEGKHHEHGGLLLRRDLHTLFDRGLLAINPDTSTIVVSPELLKFENYAVFHERKLNIELTERQLAWIRIHSLKFNWMN